MLLDGYQLVDGLLQADKAAVAGKEVYDDGYYEQFFTAVKPVLDRANLRSDQRDRLRDHRGLGSGWPAHRHARGASPHRRSRQVAPS